MAKLNVSNTAVVANLTALLTDVATAFSVTDATGYPASDFKVWVDNEIILVNTRTGTNFTSVTRGHDGTVAAQHENGAAVRHVSSAEDFQTRLLGFPVPVPTVSEDGFTLQYDHTGVEFDWVDPAFGGADGPYLPLAGGTMAGDINLDNNDLLNVSGLTLYSDSKSWRIYETGGSFILRDTTVGKNYFEISSVGTTILPQLWLVPATGDIQFRKQDNSTESLLWDQNQDRWEFRTDITVEGWGTFTSGGETLKLSGATGTANYLSFYREAVGRTGYIGHGATTDNMYFLADDGNIYFSANSVAGSSDIILYADDGTSTNRERLTIDGDGATYLRDEAGAIKLAVVTTGVTLEGATTLTGDLLVQGGDIANDDGDLRVKAIRSSAAGATLFFQVDDNAGVIHDRIAISGVSGDIGLYKNDGSTALLWDESDDRWEFSTQITVDSIISASTIKITEGQLEVTKANIQARFLESGATATWVDELRVNVNSNSVYLHAYADNAQATGFQLGQNAITISAPTATFNLNDSTLLNPTDPTAGTHIGDRDYNDARYTLSSGGPYLPLAGGTMTGGVDYDGNTIDNLLSITAAATGFTLNDDTDTRRLQLETDGDVRWYKADGTNEFLSWVQAHDALYLKSDVIGQSVFVKFSGSNDATLADDTGILQVGSSGAANLGIDGNEIVARTGTGTANILAIQPGGGQTNFYGNISMQGNNVNDVEIVAGPTATSMDIVADDDLTLSASPSSGDGTLTFQTALAGVDKARLRLYGTGDIDTFKADGTSVVTRWDESENYLRTYATTFQTGEDVYQYNDAAYGNGTWLYRRGPGWSSPSNGFTGTLAIKFPNISQMFSARVMLYNYSGSSYIELFLGGYTYVSGQYWVNTTAHAVGNVGGSSIDLKTIRFVNDDTVNEWYVLIGDSTTTWSYPKVYFEILQGHAGSVADTYELVFFEDGVTPEPTWSTSATRNLNQGAWFYDLEVGAGGIDMAQNPIYNVDVISNQDGAGLYLYATPTAAAGDFRIYVSDSGGVDRRRLYIPGSTGDIEFRDGDADTVILQWDDSLVEWRFGANLDVGGFVLDNPLDPTAGTHVGDRDYNDARYTLSSGGPYLPLGGGTMTGALNMGDNWIDNVKDPTAASHVGDRAFNDARYVNVVGGDTMEAALTIGSSPGSTFTGLSVSAAHESPTDNGVSGQVYIYSTDTVAADVGGQISFGGLYSGLSETRWAAIGGFKENVTSGQFGGWLGLYARLHGETGPSLRQKLHADGDISFYKVDGSLVSLLWDQSENEWAFSTDVSMGDNTISDVSVLQGPSTVSHLFINDDAGTARIRLRSTDSINFYGTDSTQIALFQNNTAVFPAGVRAEAGIDMQGTSITEALAVSSLDTDLTFAATNSGAAAQNVAIQADDAAGVARTRIFVDGDGSTFFSDATGTTKLSISSTGATFTSGDSVDYNFASPREQLYPFGQEVTNIFGLGAKITNRLTNWTDRGGTTNHSTTGTATNSVAAVLTDPLHRMNTDLVYDIGSTKIEGVGNIILEYTGLNMGPWSNTPVLFLLVARTTHGEQIVTNIKTEILDNTDTWVTLDDDSSPSWTNHVWMGTEQTPTGTNYPWKGSRFTISVDDQAGSLTAAYWYEAVLHNDNTSIGDYRWADAFRVNPKWVQFYSDTGWIGDTSATERIEFNKTSTDIAFYDQANAVTLLWDDSDDRWEFSTAITVADKAITGVDYLGGSSTSNLRIIPQAGLHLILRDEGNTDRIVIRNDDDIYFNDEAGVLTFKWDEVSDRWELSKWLDMGNNGISSVTQIQAINNTLYLDAINTGAAAANIQLRADDATGTNRARIVIDGDGSVSIRDDAGAEHFYVNASGAVVSDGHYYLTETADQFLLKQGSGDLYISNYNDGAAVRIQADNSVGAHNTRILIDGDSHTYFYDDDAKTRFRIDGSATQDLLFYKGDGTTTSLLWDESDDRWEFTGTTNFSENSLTGVTAIYSATDTGLIGGATGTVRVYTNSSVLRQSWPTSLDIAFYKGDGTTVSLLWDESDDRWEFTDTPYDTSRTSLLAAETWVQSRGTNLVTNGFGLLNDNTNFSGTTFDNTESYGGGGSFKKVSGSTTVLNDEFMPIDGNRLYRFTYAIKGDSYADTPEQRHYGLTIAYDADKLSISPQMVQWYDNTETTLAAALNDNDTTITLTDASNWTDAYSGDDHRQSIILFPYTNSFGYTYPDYTYSRHIKLYAWTLGGITGNVITLQTPWAGGSFPSGTKVANNYSGGSYSYIAGSNAYTPENWTVWTGAQGGWNTPGSGGNSADGFRQGTAYVKIGWLLNREAPANSTSWLDGISWVEEHWLSGGDDQENPWSFRIETPGNGDTWESQGAQVVIGEGANSDDASAAMRMSYVGTGVGYVGMGAVDGNGVTGAGHPSATSIRFSYTSGDMYFYDGVNDWFNHLEGGDIAFANDSGVTTLLWDESDSRWEFTASPYVGANVVLDAAHTAITDAHHSRYTDAEAAAKIAADDLYVQVGGDTMTAALTIDVGHAGLRLNDNDTDNAYVSFYDDDVARAGYVGFASGNMYLVSEGKSLNVYASEGDLTLRAAGTGAQNVTIYADDATGTSRTRMLIDGDGNTTFYDINAATRLTVDSSGIILAGRIGGSVTDPTADSHVGDRGYNDLRYADIANEHTQSHVLTGSDHTVSGLTTGHVLTALSATTFGFSAATGGSGATAMSDLTDVDLTGITDGQVLAFTGGTSYTQITSPVPTLDAKSGDPDYDAHNISNLLDNDGGTVFHPGVLNSEVWISMDFGEDVTLSRIKLRQSSSATYNPTSLDVWWSDTGTEWFMIVDSQTSSTNDNDLDFAATTARYWKVTTNGGSTQYWRVYELDFYVATDIWEPITAASGTPTALYEGATVRIDADPATAGDLAFYDNAGTTTTLLWDESDSQWEFSTGVSLVDQYIYYPTAVLFAQSGMTDTSDNFFIYTTSGVLYLGQYDDSAASDRNRIVLYENSHANGGDLVFLDEDGTTPRLTWDADTGWWDMNSWLNFANGSWIYGLEGILFDQSEMTDTNDSFFMRDTGGILAFVQYNSSATADLVRFEIPEDAHATRGGDIAFYKVDGSTVSLLWDESDDQWEFTTDIDMGGNSIESVTDVRTLNNNLWLVALSSTAAARDIYLAADDASGTQRNRIFIDGDGDTVLYDNTGSAEITVGTTGVDINGPLRMTSYVDFNAGLLVNVSGMTSSNNDIVIWANNTGAAPQNIELRADNASGTNTNRILVDGDGNTTLYDNAGGTRLAVTTTGVTVAGHLTSNNSRIDSISGIRMNETPGAFSLQDADGGIRMSFAAAGDIMFMDHLNATLLMWDESDDQWEFSKNVHIGTSDILFTSAGSDTFSIDVNSSQFRIRFNDASLSPRDIFYANAYTTGGGTEGDIGMITPDGYLLWHYDGVSHNMEMSRILEMQSGADIDMGGNTILDNRPAGTISDATTLDGDDNIIFATTSSASYNVTVPLAASYTGKAYFVQRKGGTHSVHVIRTSTNTFWYNGTSTYTGIELASEGAAVAIYSDGTNWIVGGTQGTVTLT